MAESEYETMWEGLGSELLAAPCGAKRREHTSILKNTPTIPFHTPIGSYQKQLLTSPKSSLEALPLRCVGVLHTFSFSTVLWYAVCMKKRYTYKLRPGAEATALLCRHAGSCRWVWNMCVERFTVKTRRTPP